MDLKMRADIAAISKRPPALAAAIAAAAVFAYEAWFFNAAGKSGTALAGGLVWAGFCAAIFAIVALGGKPDPARRVFFFTAALAFVPSFIAHLIETRGRMVLTAAEIAASQVPFCHIAITTSLVPAALLHTLDFPAQLSGIRAAFYPMLGYWLLSLVTIGRGWCSWVCFYGGLEDGISGIPRRARMDIGASGPTLRRVNKAILGFVALAGMATLVPVYCDWLCPFKLVTEYYEPSSIRTFIAMIAFIGIFLALVVVLPLLTKKRTQCSILCPFGAMQSLLDRISPFRVAIDTKACVSCGACDRACPMLAMNPATRAKGRPESSCVKCGTCFGACRKGAIGYELRLGKRAAPAKGNAPAKGALTTVGTPARVGEGPVRWGRAFMEAILSPSLLFPFTALSFGMIISSGFSAETMARIARLVATGSFLIGAGR